MRSAPEDESDDKDAKRLNAEPWMLELLDLNPSYTGWSPGDDNMKGPGPKAAPSVVRDCSGGGWDSAMICDNWADFGVTLDDLNEVVNFYFSVERDSKKCPGCDGSGYSPKAKRVSDDFYDFAGDGTRWIDKITLDEAVFLVEHHRLTSMIDGEWRRPDVVDEAFVARVNAANTRPGLGDLHHDGLNHCLLVEARCKRLGIERHCRKCDGHGYVYTAPAAHVELTLWLLHPRKGASRGIEIQRVEQAELPTIFAFLKSAADRNADRFAKVAAKATEGTSR